MYIVVRNKSISRSEILRLGLLKALIYKPVRFKRIHPRFSVQSYRLETRDPHCCRDGENCTLTSS